MAVQTKAPACHVKQPPPPSKPYCVGITPALAKQRPQLGSESFFSGLPKATLDTHGPRPQTSLQAAAWPRKLFLWASEGDVRHPQAQPSNPPRQPAGLPRPLCGLSEACLFSSPTGPAANVPAGRSLAQKAFSMGFRRQR